ncbi:MAG: redoxin domain-containing protein [Pseudomonadota bacterium]
MVRFSPAVFILGLAVLLGAGSALAQQTRVLGTQSLIDQPAPEAALEREPMGEGPHSIRPLLPGSPIPEFKLTGLTGNQFGYHPDHLERPLVITFFRGGWCPYCVTQFSGLKDIEGQLADLGYDILFVSPDKPELLSFGQPMDGDRYQVLSDSNLEAARAFGIAYQVEEDALDRYFEGGRLLSRASGFNHHQLPVPSSFIVSKNGEVIFQYSNPDHTQRIQPGLLLKAAELNAQNMASRALSDFARGNQQ